MPSEVRPYLVPAPDTVTFGKWEWAVDDGWEPLPADLPDWDPAMPIRLRRTVKVDRHRLGSETRLGDTSELGWTVSWISSTSKMRGTTPTVRLSVSKPLILRVAPPGDRIGGTLTIRTTLALLVPPVDTPLGSARLPGSVLAEDTTTLLLGSTTDRFPVQSIDFASTRLDPDASWHLETTTDLTAPFLGTFLLLVNTRDRELVGAVTRKRRDRRQEALLEELEHGVATLLLELACHLSAELSEQDAWPSGTVGDTLRRILQRADRTGPLHAPTEAQTLARTRTRLAGATRAAGHGRVLQ